MIRKHASVVICLTLVIVGLLASPAFAPERAALSVSATKRVDEKNYPDPLVGTVGPALVGTPVGCRSTFRSCDLVPLDIGAPSTIKPADAYLIKITLSWTAPGNDIDLMLWTCQDNTALSGCTQVASTRTISVTPPEILSTGDLPGKRYFLTPQNQSGPNTGYRLKAEFLPTAFSPYNPPPKPQPESPTPAGALTVKGPPRVPPPPQEETTDGEPATPSVKLPGSDTEPQTTELPELASNQTSSTTDGGISPLLVAALATTVLLAALAWFLLRRRRRAEKAL